MKRIFTSLVVAVLALSATNGFAQLVGAAKSAKNIANLNKAIERAVTPAFGRPVLTGLPAGMVPGNSIGLVSVKMPKTVTPVTHSYVQYLRTLGAKRPVDLIPHTWMGPKGEHVLYTDQNELARDLNKFYQGQADVYQSPGGHPVKLYALPVDGLLYYQTGYEVPLVLSVDEYFVVFDVVTKTGRIVENTPQVYTLYKRIKPTDLHQNLEAVYRQARYAMITDSWTSALQEKVRTMIHMYPEEPTSRIITQASDGHAFTRMERRLPALYGERRNQYDASIYQLEKRTAEEDRSLGTWQEVWQQKFPSHFANVNELGNALSKFYRRWGSVVENQASEEFFRVYELPVNDLSYQLPTIGTQITVPVDADKYVILFKSPTHSILIDRETLENSNNFKFYSHYFLL